MIIWYVYVILCWLAGLIFSIIWPNFSYLTSINEFLWRVYLQNPYGLVYTFMLAIFWILLWLIGYFSKNKNIKNIFYKLFIFAILWFFALYFGFMIGLFKEYTFDNLWDYRVIGY